MHPLIVHATENNAEGEGACLLWFLLFYGGAVFFQGGPNRETNLQRRLSLQEGQFKVYYDGAKSLIYCRIKLG